MSFRATIGATAWVASVVVAFVAGTYLPRTIQEPLPESSAKSGMNSRSAGSRGARPGDTTAGAPTLHPRVTPQEGLAALQGLLIDGSTEAFGAALEDLSTSWRENEEAALLQLTVQAWGQRDGAAAIKHLSAREHDPAFAKWALEQLVAGWASADAPAALVWASEAHDPSLMLTALRIAAQQEHGQAALQAAARLPQNRQSGAATQIATGALLGRTPAEAKEWFAANVRGNSLEALLLQPFAHRLAQLSAPDAAAWASTLPERNYQIEASQAIARYWARQAPSEAAAWAQALTDTDVRSYALAEVVKGWTPQNAQDAGEWLSTLPSGPDLDRSVAAFVEDAAQTHPEIAAQWVPLITDDRARGLAARRVSSSWNRRDPVAAARWRQEIDSR